MVDHGGTIWKVAGARIRQRAADFRWDVTPGPHRIRQRCSGPVCDRPSASRRVPSGQNRLQAPLEAVLNETERAGTRSDGRKQGWNSADGCGEDRALVRGDDRWLRSRSVGHAPLTSGAGAAPGGDFSAASGRWETHQLTDDGGASVAPRRAETELPRSYSGRQGATVSAEGLHSQRLRAFRTVSAAESPRSCRYDAACTCTAQGTQLNCCAASPLCITYLNVSYILCIVICGC